MVLDYKASIYMMCSMGCLYRYTVTVSSGGPTGYAGYAPAYPVKPTILCISYM
jgi:hypothetical protein